MAQLQRLITTDNGGFPLVLDDIRWLEGGIYYAIRQFADDVKSGTGVGLNGGVISGCQSVVTVVGPPNIITISAGLVVINGELYHFAGGTFQSPIAGGSSVYLTPKSPQTFDSAGNKQFQSGVSYDTYEERQVEIVVKATGSATVNDLNMGALGRDAFYFDGPTYGILSGNYQSGYGAGAGANAPLYRMFGGKRVHFTGQIVQTGSPATIATDVHVATIDTNYYPIQNILQPFVDANNAVGYYEIKTNGQIHIRGDLANTLPPVLINVTYPCRR